MNPPPGDLEENVFARLVPVSSPYDFGDAVGAPFWVYVCGVEGLSRPYIRSLDVAKLVTGAGVESSMARLLCNYRILDVDKSLAGAGAIAMSLVREYAIGRGYR